MQYLKCPLEAESKSESITKAAPFSNFQLYSKNKHVYSQIHITTVVFIANFTFHNNFTGVNIYTTYSFKLYSGLKLSSSISSRHTLIGSSVCPLQLHPLIQKWSLLATKNQDGDKHNVKHTVSQTSGCLHGGSTCYVTLSLCLQPCFQLCGSASIT